MASNGFCYSITGKVNMEGNWQPQIFLATINKLDDYYDAKAEAIINTAAIDASGNFTLQGDNLPQEPRYYRLYLIKEEHSEFNACLFVGGEEHNFVHVILDNSTELELTADTTTFAPFGDYSLVGDANNLSMKHLNTLVYPSYHFYEIKFPSELQFSQDKLNRDLIHFADTCQSTLAALAALNNTDIDEYFMVFNEDYKAFAERLSKAYPNHTYTKDYYRKLRYFTPDGYDDALLWKIVSAVLAIICMALGLVIINGMRSVNTQEPKTASPTLTPQEEKIFRLILDGKSNKEIAADLYVELSTVKTHINKLYSKIGVGSRKELFAKYQ